jgi:hypothetical protein
MSPESQLRNQKLKQFVEEALDVGVFYERDCLIPGFDGAFLSPEWRDALLYSAPPSQALLRHRPSHLQAVVSRRALLLSGIGTFALPPWDS